MGELTFRSQQNEKLKYKLVYICYIILPRYDLEELAHSDIVIFKI